VIIDDRYTYTVTLNGIQGALLVAAAVLDLVHRLHQADRRLGSSGRGFTEDRMDDAFRDGLQAMREMLARFVEQGGDSLTAISIRANWNPDWGADPGKPDAVASTWD